MPAVGGFDVTTVIDKTAQDISIAVSDFLADRRPQDLVVMYVSCHGVTDPRRRLYFTATDTDKSRLAATGVESAWVLEQLEECRARSQVVILDCCFSGAFARGAKGDDDLHLQDRLTAHGRGRAVLTASNAQEYSFEGGATGNLVEGSATPGSVFTTALLDGLSDGAADVDGDGFISVDEAYDYACRQVRAMGVAQTPQRWLSAGEGDLLLARNRTGIPVTPVPIPDALRAALESPLPRVRIGAVAELGDWLAFEDPGRTLSALRVLQDVADNDIPRVATAARELMAAHPTVIPPKSAHVASLADSHPPRPTASERPDDTARARSRPQLCPCQCRNSREHPKHLPSAGTRAGGPGTKESPQ